MTSPASFAAPADSLGGDPILELARDALVSEIFLASIALAAALLVGGSVRRNLSLVPGRLPVREVAVLCIGLLAFSHALDCAIAWSGWLEHSVLAEIPKRLEGARGRHLLIALISLAVVPAFAEEMLCRGLIQRVLVARIGPILGIAVASLVFGALHIDPVHVLVATGLGLYLGIVAHWAGSIWPCVVCHAVNNAAAVLAASQWMSTPGSPTTGSIGAVISVVCLLWVRRRRPEDPAALPPGV